MSLENKDRYAAERRRMVAHIERHGVASEDVLRAMGEVPRECFVADRLVDLAYEDGPLPIDAGQTISQPFIVAFMIEAADVEAGTRVLEIGTGSGYSAAVMAAMGASVVTIERHDSLAESAALRLGELGYDRVEVHPGDGTLGWPAKAPYDAIIVTAGGPAVPETLRAQLAAGGRLVMPVGAGRRSQRLVKLVRIAEDDFNEDTLEAVAFVPLIGEHGWTG